MRVWDLQIILKEYFCSYFLYGYPRKGGGRNAFLKIIAGGGNVGSYNIRTIIAGGGGGCGCKNRRIPAPPPPPPPHQSSKHSHRIQLQYWW